jgi:hypothetical protein
MEGNADHLFLFLEMEILARQLMRRATVCAGKTLRAGVDLLAVQHDVEKSPSCTAQVCILIVVVVASTGGWERD